MDSFLKDSFRGFVLYKLKSQITRFVLIRKDSYTNPASLEFWSPCIRSLDHFPLCEVCSTLSVRFTCFFVLFLEEPFLFKWLSPSSDSELFFKKAEAVLVFGYYFIDWSRHLPTLICSFLNVAWSYVDTHSGYRLHWIFSLLPFIPLIVQKAKRKKRMFFVSNKKAESFSNTSIWKVCFLRMFCITVFVVFGSLPLYSKQIILSLQSVFFFRTLHSNPSY